ncbi:MAG: TonB family protein [Candidatus Krumholzibacteriia bacterium]
MSALTITRDLWASRRRTRKWLFRSVAAHVLFFAFLSLYHRIVPEPPAITEITWIDDVEAAAATALTSVAATNEAAPGDRTTLPRSSPRKNDKTFERERAIADLAPRAQSVEAIEDKLSERLASLQHEAAAKPNKIASLALPSSVARPRLAGAIDVARTSRPGALTRTATARPKPIALARSRTTIAKAIVPTPPPERPAARARSEATESAARRELAGAHMTGPVADRPIVSYNAPPYPEWAKREGVEASVMIYFVVLPDGHVKENVMVQKTSGFTDFDDNAVNAILAWQFQPLRPGTTGEQWGTIMFHYRLSGAD